MSDSIFELANIFSTALKFNKWDESEHPRHPAGSEEGGEFAPAGGGGGGGTSSNDIRVVARTGVKTRELNLVKAGVKAVPVEHAKKVKAVPVYVVRSTRDIPVRGNAPESSKTTGLFQWAPGEPRIYIPTHKIYDYRDSRGEMVTWDTPLKNITRDTVHEIGHALDHHNDWELGNKIREACYIAERDMTAREKKKADYFIHDIKEMFAEVYTLAYNPVKTGTQRYFGGMKRERAEEVFAEALRIVKAMDGDERGLPEEYIRDFVTSWSDDTRWEDYQHAARAVINGLPRDEYVCYDCHGDDKDRYDITKEMLDTIEQSPVGKVLYRGLVTGGDYKVGDRFSESMSSWTGKKNLAALFADGHFSADEPDPTIIVLMQSSDMKGVNVSSRLPSTSSEVLRKADEWLTSGQYEVVKVNQGDVREVFVRRVGPASKDDLKKSMVVE